MSLCHQLYNSITLVPMLLQIPQQSSEHHLPYPILPYPFHTPWASDCYCTGFHWASLKSFWVLTLHGYSFYYFFPCTLWRWNSDCHRTMYLHSFLKSIRAFFGEGERGQNNFVICTVLAISTKYISLLCISGNQLIYLHDTAYSGKFENKMKNWTGSSITITILTTRAWKPLFAPYSSKITTLQPCTWDWCF